jgi:glycosyltransferase involved in cell wall biosynthesis
MTVKTLMMYPFDPFGPKIGGAETFIKGFIKFSPEDFDVEFIGISSNRQKHPPKKWTRSKLGNREFNFLPLFYEQDENKKTIIPMSLKFTLALKFSKIDVTNKVLLFNRIEPILLFRKTKYPKIVVIHNDIQKQIITEKSEVSWSKFPKLYFMFEHFIFISIDYIYSVNNNTLEFYESKYPEQIEKFSFLPTWVDKEIFFPTDEPKFTIRKKLHSVNKLLSIEKKWILFAGRLQEQKAPIRLIDTFNEYYKKDETACLIIMGEGNLRKSIEAHIRKLKIENKVFLLNNMNQKILASFYRASDVLLLTSHYEGMARCVLEALGCGLPVVSTNVGEVKRVVINDFSGEVVESFSPKIIAQSVEKVLSNPDIYSKDNCIKAVSEYTPQEVLKSVYEMLRRLYSKGYMVGNNAKS